MKFELVLQNDLEQTKTLNCDIFADWFHLGLMNPPEVIHWNVFHKHDALDRLYTIVEELDKKINTWNEIADAYKTDNIPLSEILGNIVMSSGNAFCKIDNKLGKFKPLREWYDLDKKTIDHKFGLVVHQDILNPMQTQVILIYRVLNDQNLINHIDKLMI